jgi:hypothetical protein
MKRVGNNIQIFNEMCHLTDDEIAKELAVSGNNFAKIENVKTPICDATVHKISEVLGICVEALIHFDPEKFTQSRTGKPGRRMQETLIVNERISKIETKLQELYSLVINLVQVVDVVQKINSNQNKSCE